MHPQSTAPRDGLVVASGYGIKIYVERGHLVVHDGICNDRTTRRFNRATARLKRVVVIGEAGFITLEAGRWIRDVGAAYVHLDRDGALLAASAPRASDHPALRRAQALATGASAGLEIARDLIREKVEGQAAIAAQLPPNEDARRLIQLALEGIEQGTSIDALVSAEAQAADAYWTAWAEVPVPFGGRDREHAPAHWLAFGQRSSQLTSAPRLATNPSNAILNYLYSLLEAETTLALRTVGLDPGLGIVHTDKRSRASLTLDVMEACRPVVDAYLLALLTERKLRARDFVESRRGVCRVLPGLAADLSTTTATWRPSVAPVAERVARLIAESAGHATPPTPLTQSTRRAALGRRSARKQRRSTRSMRLPATCRGCGDNLTDKRRHYCATCLRERFTDVSERGRPAAAAVLARLRADGRDPAHGGDAAVSRGKKNAAHQRAVAQWEQPAGESDDPAEFLRQIAPRLRTCTIGELTEATGLSPTYCSLIRLGKRVPHTRHWHHLRALADGSKPEPSTAIALREDT
jgi:CRISPR-associated protein Cas1